MPAKQLFAFVFTLHEHTHTLTATGTHTHRQGKGRDLMNQIRGIKMWLNVSNN